MEPLPPDLLPLAEDPVLRLLLSGGARTVHEAEEMYLDNCLPEFLALLRGPWTNDELETHPLITLLVAHGSRGWEDSLL